MLSAPERELVFRNLLNGVPLETVAQTFRLQPHQALAAFEFVLRKIKSYAFEHRLPPVMVDTVAQARRGEHRLVLLTVLARLNLAKEPMHRRISYASIEEVIRVER
jgi:hypothetical protein